MSRLPLRSHTRALVTALGALLLCTDPFLGAAGPPWWQDRGVLSTDAANDFAAINQGQLKTLVWAAMLEFEAQFRDKGIRGPILAVVNSWSNGASGANTSDFAAVNLGQLKTAAAPFYERLGLDVPWNGATAPANDSAMANIGQAKSLFAFAFQIDADNDRLPDLVERALGYDPNSAADSDGDLLPDDWERFFFEQAGVDFDPADVDGSVLAARGDGFTIRQAFQARLSPHDIFNGHGPVLTKIFGDQQAGTTGTTLPIPLAVAVTTASGALIRNARVEFSIGGATWPGGSSSPIQMLTDILGRASVSVALPASPATFSVTATAGTGIHATSAIFSGVAELPPPPPPAGASPPPAATGSGSQPYLKVRTSYNAEANPAFDTYTPTTPRRRYLIQDTVQTGFGENVGDIVNFSGGAAWTERRSLIRGPRFTGMSFVDELDDYGYGLLRLGAQSNLKGPNWDYGWIGSFTSTWETGPLAGMSFSGSLDSAAWSSIYFNHLQFRSATRERYDTGTMFWIRETSTLTLSEEYPDETFLAETIRVAEPLGPWRGGYWGMVIAERFLSANGTQASILRSQYKVAMPIPSEPRTVTWLEVFRPDNPSSPVIVRTRTWEFNGTDLESGTYALGPVNCSENGAWSLLPFELNSMDRFVAGAIPQSVIDGFGGDSNFGLVFRHKTTGETYAFNQLSEAYVYDNPYNSDPEGEDKFLSNSEIALGYNGQLGDPQLSQDVVFYRQDGKLHFRALFDTDGKIEIGIVVGGNEIGKIEWELHGDLDIGHLAETVDTILGGTWGSPPPQPLAMMAAPGGGAAAAAMIPPTSFPGYFAARGLTIKVLMPTWDNVKTRFETGARKAGAAVARALQVAAFGGKGFCEGAWMGVKDDATSLGELVKMVANPAETAKTFYEGFKVLMKLDANGWKNVGKTLVKSFLETGQNGVDDWAEPNNLDVAAYLVGYTSGFITEQIAVTYITAGILKAGNIGAKLGNFIRGASKGVFQALETTADVVKKNAMKIKNSVFRRFSQEVLSEDDVRKFKKLLEDMQLDCCPGI